MLDQNLNYSGWSCGDPRVLPCTPDGCEQTIEILAPASNTYRLYFENDCRQIGSAGSSIAAPVISGIVALMKDVNPCLTPPEIEHIIKETANEVNQSFDLDPSIGYVNAYEAVLMAKDYNHQDYIFVSGSTNWDNLNINANNIVIEAGAELIVNNSVVNLLKESSIEVRRGGRLIIDNSKLTTCETWKGIEVWGNAAIEQPDPYSSLSPDNAGILIIKNNSIIENAKEAIYTIDRDRSWPEHPQYFGGLVIAENSTFKNNRRTAAFMAYSFENKSYFHNCNFIEADDISEKSIGVTIWACRGIEFTQNKFENLDLNGIYGINAQIKVEDENEFINCKTGIGLLSTNPFASSAQIGSNNSTTNEFFCWMEGIYADGVDQGIGLNIENNHIIASNYGIFVEGNSAYRISENTLEEHFQYAMVHLENGSNNNIIICNEIDSDYEGVYFYGNNIGTQFLSNDFGVPGDDIIITGSSSSPGRLNWQGGLNSANNCFSNSPFDEINSNSTFTDPFVYFIPTQTENNCKVPTNNLSDGGTNNYYNIQSGDEQNSCNLFSIPNQASLSDLENIKVEILNQKNFLKGDESIGDTDLLKLKKLELEKEFIIRSIIDGYLETSDFNSIYNIYSNEPEPQYQLLAFGAGLKIKTKNEILSLLDSLDFVDQEFKGIQEINIDRIYSLQEFILSENDKEFLFNIANGYSKNRGYARALLFILEGEVFHGDILGANNQNIVIPNNEVNTGFNEDLNNEVLIYPNPSLINGQLTITSKSKISNISVYSIDGKLIIKKDLINDFSISFNLPKKGLYFINIEDIENKVEVKKHFVR